MMYISLLWIGPPWMSHSFWTEFQSGCLPRLLRPPPPNPSRKMLLLIAANERRIHETYHPQEPFDLSFELISGSNRVRVLCEVKRTFTPSLLQQIVPWIQRFKSLRPDVAIAA